MNLSKKNLALYVIFVLSFIVGLVFLIMPFVWEKPDVPGKVLEETMGFLKKDDFWPIRKAPVADYRVSALKQGFNRQYAAIIGAFVIFGASVFAGYLLKKRRKNL